MNIHHAIIEGIAKEFNAKSIFLYNHYNTDWYRIEWYNHWGHRQHYILIGIKDGKIHISSTTIANERGIPLYDPNLLQKIKTIIPETIRHHSTSRKKRDRKTKKLLKLLK